MIRWQSILLIGLMLLTVVSSCSYPDHNGTENVTESASAETGQTRSETADASSVWILKDTQDIDAPGSFPVAVCSCSGETDILYSHEDEERTVHYYVYRLTSDGTTSSMECRGIPAEVSVLSFAARNGFNWVLAEKMVSVAEEQQDILYCFDQDGELLSEIRLPGKAVGVPQAAVEGFVWLEDPISRRVTAYASDGELVKSFEMPEEGVDMITEGKNGAFYGLAIHRDGTGFDVIPFGENGFEEKISWNRTGVEMVFPGIKGLFIFASENTLYEYYPESGSEKRMLSFSECGVDGRQVYSILGGSNEELYILSCGNDLNKIRLSVLEKSIDGWSSCFITLGVLKCTDEMNELIALYNRSGRPYTILVHEYSSDIGASAEEEDALKRMNADLISGEGIDIVDLSGVENINIRKQYAETGILQDLYPFMEGDPELNPEDYQEQVFKANEIDGCLYNLVAFYGIDTVFGRSSLYRGKKSIRPDEAFETDDPLMVYGRDYTSGDILRSYCQYVLCGSPKRIRTEMDNAERLLQLFQFASAYPESPSGGESIRDMHEGKQQMEAVGNSSSYSLGRSLERYMRCKALMGEDVCFIGYPTNEGNGSAFYNIVSVGMCTSSQNKEGVWDFFRFLLDENTQKNTEDVLSLKRALPVHLSAWNEACRAAMVQEAGNGAGIFREDEEWYVIFPVITQSEVDNVNDLIRETDRVREFDYSLYNLLQEEFNNYRTGVKSLEGSVNSLQSRVRNYLDEIQ